MTSNIPDEERPAKEKSSRRIRRRPSEKAIDAPTLGYIPPTPESPAPTLSDPMGDAAAAYGQALDRIQAATAAHILLVTGAIPGSGPTLAALNLGFAATRIGLRCVVIDGDTEGGGPSQYLRTGSDPGLAELASGEADLKAASRLLTMDDGGRLPVIPAGESQPGAELSPNDLAEPIDRISEHTDLVLIVIAATASEQWAAALGAHADGTLLIVDGSEQQGAVVAAAERLAKIGAPVTGLIELAPQRRGIRRKRGG